MKKVFDLCLLSSLERRSNFPGSYYQEVTKSGCKSALHKGLYALNTIIQASRGEVDPTSDVWPALQCFGLC